MSESVNLSEALSPQRDNNEWLREGLVVQASSENQQLNTPLLLLLTIQTGETDSS
jgi:hypothetical protein